MWITRRTPLGSRSNRHLLLFLAVACSLLPRVAATQGLTGTLIAAVKDEQGGALAGARVRIGSPAQMGGPVTVLTDEKGQVRFPVLAPGKYVLDTELKGFATYHEEDIRIGAGATIEIPVVLKLLGLAESVVVHTTGSRIEARTTGFETRFDFEHLRAIPTPRSSMFDAIRAAPGVSPTSPASATTTTVSAFGSGVNENVFHIDGTNGTCPCNGVARAELGVDFIQEVQVLSVGASVEFGNMQGAVFNVITRQGGDRLSYDAAYYGQTAGLTSQPVLLPLEGGGVGQSGYERDRYRDLTTTLGGPVVGNRLWFFAGYQYLRDYDSQPGSDPAFPRTYEQDKIFAKLTWRLTPALQLMQSFHNEFWVRPDPPTSVTPFEATLRRSATVPAMTFGHLTHTLSPRTVWDVRAGRFFYDETRTPSTGDVTTPNRSDRDTGISSAAPPQIGGLTLIRTTAKATINHYQPQLLRLEHQWKAGLQIERGEQHGANVIPTGARYEDRNGQPFHRVSSDPSRTGGLSITASAFVSDAITVGDRMTINAGMRFDHSRAISQDVRGIDSDGRDTDGVVEGLGTLYTWNVLSPRLGVTAKVTSDGRTVLRSTYGRFSQGVLTGEISGFHPGVTPSFRYAFDAATADYTRFVRRIDSSNLQYDPELRAPRTDEFSLGVDREVARRLSLAVAYVHKNGSDFIGWTDIGGQYREEVRRLRDGRLLPVFALVNSTSDQRFLLTNPDGYSMRYDGLVLAAEKRRSHGWQAVGSYTYSRTSGLQASSGATAAAPQASTVAAPTTIFGRDPNDITNARGRLPNDRPHMFRLMGAIDIPRTGFVLATSLQHFSGKPWAATALTDLPPGPQRIFLEPRGTRRLSSQSLVDLRVSRTFHFGRAGRVEFLIDVLNALNDSAEESLATDDFFSAAFGEPTVFIHPRRAMFGLRLNLGR